MAADPNPSPVRLKTIVWILILLSLSISFSWSECIDGTYEHEGKVCCKCAIGLYVAKHCSVNGQYGTCEVCKPDTYSSEPNDQMQCEPCTSCLHPNDNLEEDLTCTSARNSKCRCRKDHYCASETEICRLCHPCNQCGAEGIKVPCTAHKNSVCNVAGAGGSDLRVLFLILGLALVVLVLFILAAVWFRKRKIWQMSPQPTAQESLPIRVSEMDIQPLVPDIAEVLGWKDMQDVAMRDGIKPVAIDSFKLNSPGNSAEQTLQLLRHFVEKNGMTSGQTLIDILQRSGKKGKAEKVGDILKKGCENKNCHRV